MAVIPGSQGFGDVVARPQRFNETQTTPRAFGSQFGQVLTDIGQQQVSEQLAEEKRQQRIAAEAQEAADKAKATTEFHAASDDLDMIAEEVATGLQSGSIAKDEAFAEYQRRAKERVDRGLEQVPQSYRDVVGGDLTRRLTKAGRSVSGAVVKRNMDDVRAGIGQTLEYAQRLYLTEPQKADELVAGTLQALGPHSGLSQEQLRVEAQRWREGTRFNAAQTLVNGARRSNADLAKVEQLLQTEQFADLDPQRRTTLYAQIEGFRVSNAQRAEAEARRAQAAQEMALRRAQSEFDGARALIESGKTLSPEYVQRVTAATAGTPFAGALPELMRQAPEKSAFAQQPVPVMEASLREARALLNQRGTDPETEKRVAGLERVLAEARKDYDAEPLMAAQERGIVERVAPIDTSSLPGLVQSVAARVGQAEIAARQAGRPVSPLLGDEAAKVGQMLSGLPVSERATAVANLASVIPPKMAAALARQIDPKDRALALMIAAGTSQTTAGRFTAELIGRGAQAIKDKTVKEDSAAEVGLRATLAAAVGDSLSGQARDDVIDSARFIYLGMQAEGSADPARAVRLAIGGDIVEHNGRRVPVTAGVTPDTLKQRLRTYPVAQIDQQAPDGFVYLPGGRPMGVPEFLAALPDAQLEPAGRGRYVVRSGGSIVTNADRRPITVEVR